MLSGLGYTLLGILLLVVMANHSHAQSSASMGGAAIKIGAPAGAKAINIEECRQRLAAGSMDNVLVDGRILSDAIANPLIKPPFLWLTNCTITSDLGLKQETLYSIRFNKCILDRLTISGVSSNGVMRPCRASDLSLESCDCIGLNCYSVEFDGSVALIDSHFHFPINFGSVKLNGGIRLLYDDQDRSSSSLDTGVMFSAVTISSRCMFSGAAIRADQGRIGSLYRAGLSPKRLGFDHCTFECAARFNRASISDEVFDNCEFKDLADFTDTSIEQDLTLNNCRFFGEAWFKRCKGGKLEFSGDTFQGSVDWSQIPSLSELSISAQPTTTFQSRVHIDNSAFGSLSLNGSEFRAYVDLSATSVKGLANFDGCKFGDDLNLRNLRMPVASDGNRGAFFNNTLFDKSIRCDWSVFGSDDKELMVSITDPTQWQALEEAFVRAGNLEAANECLYQRGLLEYRQNDPPRGKFGSAQRWFSRVTWGFGARPWRLLLCIVGASLFFSIVYSFFRLPDADEVEKSKSYTVEVSNPVGKRVRHLEFKIDTSPRNPQRAATRWNERILPSIALSWRMLFTFKFEEAKGFRQPVKTIALIQLCCAKVSFVFLLQAAANQSPLLHELLGKFVT
jgi:hypothetical protein